jgi:uncharacterized protein YdhG (YjbR/CyaY superfamily)
MGSSKETGMPAPSTVDEYMAALPADRRANMEELRQTIKAAAPEAIELLSYKMPAFKSHGQFLVSYDAFQNHYSLFPASDAVRQACGDELRPYLTGKATISFPKDRPLPAALVTKIVEVRLAEHVAGGRR